MDNRYEIAEQNGMSLEFADWFFDNKKDGCGNTWFVMMAAMWEGWKGRAEPPVPDKIAQAIENLKQKLVECNRYNYCADAVKGVEDASRVLAFQNQNMSAPITPEAIENAIEYIRSIAFHIDEDDYHGKHIAYFMRQALAWLEGHSCSADSQDKSDNSPLPRYQVIELTMLVKQLVSQLKKAKPDCKLPDRAMDYLLRNGLVSVEGVLR
ncbi:hypothetical protein [Escherichia sp. E14S1]|uniref:hypothetical protein n=1 Tax=Escherichia sp. E14S1 TaxID=2478968 RepID=UPI001F111CE6|nr:hypothetical protein [Escherichia sp. E14S1]